MAKKKRKKKKASSIRKRYFSLAFIIVALFVGGIFIYISSNFNSLLSSKIYSIYRQTELANYYSLHFDKLRVNLISMSVRIYGVSLEAHKSEHKDFYSSNGSLNIYVGKIVLKNASIFEFISSNNISVDEFTLKDSQIKLYKPNKQFTPFAFIKESSSNDSLYLKLSIGEFNINHAQLQEFTLAYIPENSFDDFTMKVDSVNMNIEKGQFDFSFERLLASLDQMNYKGKGQMQIAFDKYEVSVLRFALQKKEKQFDFDFQNFNFLITKPRFITKDSVYTISAQNLLIDKSRKTLRVKNLDFHPNLTKQQFVKHNKYQKLRANVQVEDVFMKNINFDRLFDNEGVYADSVIVSGVVAKLYKSKVKPLGKSRIPHYLALQIRSIDYPLAIKVVKAKDVEIDFSVQQEDKRLSAISINKLNGTLYNVQNKSKGQKLKLYAKGYVENSIPFNATLVFNYDHDRFTYKGQVLNSRLTKLSKVVRSFASVEIKSGVIKNLQFRGVANRTDSRGSMVFLYNNLNIQLMNKEPSSQKRFGKYLLSFAANTYMLSNNPANANLPPREVHFFIGREMNKGFINILVKSILEGVKETLVPSRENRKRYKQKKQTQ